MARADNQNPYTRHKRKPFQYPPDWAGFVDFGDQRIVQILGTGKEPEKGPDVVLFLTFRVAYKTQMAIDLSRFTEEELDAFKQFVNDTIELARPIVQQRDRVAKENYERGIDSDPRIYRGVPKVIRRPWAVGIDASSVLDRLEDIPRRPEPEKPASRRAGVPRGPLVEPDAARSEAQDDAAEDNES